MNKLYKLTLWQDFVRPQIEERYNNTDFSGKKLWQALMVFYLILSLQTFLIHKAWSSIIITITLIAFLKVKAKQIPKLLIFIRLMCSVICFICISSLSKSLQLTSIYAIFAIHSATSNMCLLTNISYHIIFYQFEVALLKFLIYRIRYGFYFYISVIYLVYLGFPLLLISYFLEIWKKRKFIESDFYSKEQRCYHQLVKTISIPIYLIDANRELIFFNDEAKRFLRADQKGGKAIGPLERFFDETSVMLVQEFIKRPLIGGTSIKLVYKKNDDEYYESLKKVATKGIQYPQEFFIKEIIIADGKFYELTQTSYVNDQIQDKDIEIINNMAHAAEQLFTYLTQDYEKRNNLRAFNVFKEKDLENLGKCVADCLFFKTTIESLQFIHQDFHQKGDFQHCDFNMKNFILNVFECFSLRMMDRLTSMNVIFEESVPEVLCGDKNKFIFIIWSLLWCLLNDVQIKKYEITLKITIGKVDFEINGYEINFSLGFNCSNHLANLMQKAFVLQIHRVSSQPNLLQSTNNPTYEIDQFSDAMKFQHYILSKSKQIIKSQDLTIHFEHCCDPGKSPSQTETNLRRQVVFQQKFQLPKSLPKTETEPTIKDTSQQKYILNNKRIKNVALIDLSFTRTAVSSFNYQWKPKKITSMPIPIISHKKLAEENANSEKQLNEEKKEKLDAHDEKNEIAPFSRKSSIVIKEADEDSEEESDSSLESTIVEHKISQLLEDEIKRILGISCQLDDNLKTGFQIIVEETIKKIISKGVNGIDVSVCQDEEEDQDTFRKLMLNSQNTLIALPSDEQLRSAHNSSPGKFSFPNKPGGYSKFLSMDVNKSEISERNESKGSPHLTDGSFRDLHNHRMRQTQKHLLSPQVMQRISSMSLKRMANRRKNSASSFGEAVSRSIEQSPIDDQIAISNLQCSLHIKKARQQTQKRVWTNRLSVFQKIQRTNTLLFYTNHMSWMYYIEKICNYDHQKPLTMYGVKEIHDILREYKKFVLNGFVYNLIIIVIDLKHVNDIIEVLTTIRMIEKANTHMKTYITGLVDKTGLVPLPIQQLVNAILQAPIDDFQISKMKMSIDICYSSS